MSRSFLIGQAAMTMAVGYAHACALTNVGDNHTCAIAASDYSSCALTAAGGVRCWGALNNALIPADVAGLGSGVIEIGIGHDYACALTGNHGMLCWGANGSGQLGDGSTAPRSAPAYVTGLSGGNAVNQTIDFTAPPDGRVGDPPLALTATASSGLAVGLQSITPGVCAVSGTQAILIAAGTCTIVATR